MSWSVMGGKGFSTLSQNSKVRFHRRVHTDGAIFGSSEGNFKKMLKMSAVL